MAYVTYDKLSKKKQRERDLQKRGSWGYTNPVTRKINSAKLYDRKKAQRWQRVPDALGFFMERKTAGLT